MKQRYIWWAIAGAALALGASAVPVLAADNGTVNAQVVAGGAACLTVSSAVDFGTAQFQALGSSAVTVGTPGVAVTSCATGSETILARGTDATAPGTIWTLTLAAQCSPQAPANLYNLGLRAGGNDPDVYLSTANTSLGSLVAAGTLSRTPIMRMPCTGSAGTGQTMTMSYVFTATAP
jgi:hypothetical protein